MNHPMWPSVLPQEPLLAGFSSSGQQPVRRLQMESGPDRVTRTSSQTVRFNNTAWGQLTDRQVAAFWSFYEHEANAGADWVLIPVRTGNVVAPHLCRISSYPSQSRMGRGWQISFTVETTDQPIDWSV